MARTVGSTSNLTMKFPTLLKAIGAGYEGNIMVNRNWFSQTAEEKGYRVQVFPTGKKSGAKIAPKSAPKAKAAKKPTTKKPPTPKYNKPAKPKKAKPAKPANVINLGGETFTVKPAPPIGAV